MRMRQLLCLVVLVACGGKPLFTVDLSDPSRVRIRGNHLIIDEHIHFATDSDEILEDSSSLLDDIATTLKNHTEIVSVRIVGHTDFQGEEAHNQELSARRAAAVKKALESRSVIQPLVAEGRGESELLCQEDTDACHSQNRRVEFIVGRKG